MNTDHPAGDTACITTLDAVDDVVLADAVRDGDTAAFGEIFRRHHRQALALAYSIAPCPSVAEDAVAEAFAGTFSALRRGRGPHRAIRAYLFTAVRAAVIHHYRDLRRLTPTCEIDDVADRTSSPEEMALNAVESRDQLVRVASACLTLSRKQRAILDLVVLKGHTSVRVAAGLGLSPNAVGARMMRARRALEERLAELLEEEFEAWRKVCPSPPRREAAAA